MIAYRAVVFEGTRFIGNKGDTLFFTSVNNRSGNVKLVYLKIVSATTVFKGNFNRIALIDDHTVGSKGERNAGNDEFLYCYFFVFYYYRFFHLRK